MPVCVQSSSRRRPAALMLVIAALGATFFFAAESPAQGGSSRGGSSFLRRQKQQEQQQIEAMKQQRIAQLQAQFSAASKQLETARPQAVSAASEAKVAVSRVQSARDVVKADDEEIRNQQRRMRDAEDRVLSTRPADAPDVAKEKQVRDEQRQLDDRMHDLLVLPRTVPAEQETEQIRQTELLHLTTGQRDQLKRDADYAKLNDQLAADTKELKTLQQAALEADKEWSAAHEAWQAARSKKAEDEDDLHRAGGASAQARKAMLAANAQLAAAQSAMQSSAAELMSLGTKPQVPTQKK